MAKPEGVQGPMMRTLGRSMVNYSRGLGQVLRILVLGFRPKGPKCPNTGYIGLLQDLGIVLGPLRIRSR